MNCPRCNGDQHCPCRNCAKDNKGKVTWKWDASGELISCGHCGYTMHADGWLDAEARFFAMLPSELPGVGE